MHVLIATDGTIDVEKATEFATALAGSDGRVTVLTVIEVDRGLVAVPGNPSEGPTTALAAGLRAAGAAVEVVVFPVSGAGSGIMDAVDELEPDVLVIDPRGGGLFEGLLAPTGAGREHRARYPVLVLRKDR